MPRVHLETAQDMNYNFSNLLPADFEDLAIDLIGRELGVRFEAFCAGPDGGVDGRHATAGNSTILQVKHYAGSTVATLQRTMKRERKSIDRLAPTRYILATSRLLSPLNKRGLAKIVGPSLNSESDILGPSDLNALLRKYPEIEKAHIKLWLSGSAVLERVVRSAAYFFTTMSKEEIERKVCVYAQNRSFNEAQKKLEAHHVLIVSGPPGVGKTTLAEMLSYAYVGDGYEFIAIRSLDDGFSAIVDSKRQIFFFDDFLGKIALDARALSSKDSDLARFMKRIQLSPNARFVLTTRAYIFEEARRVSEYLSDRRVDMTKYVLDVSVYTRSVRARILYNHLLLAGTPKPHVKALIQSGKIKNIVDHKNYSPRVVEWMTDALRVADVAPVEYAGAFLQALANPRQLWDIAFRTHIPEKCRHLLFALFFCSEYGAEIEALRPAFISLHQFLSTKYKVANNPKDFEEALRILEGGFIALRDRQVSFINPSLRDYLAEYLDDIGMLGDFATTAKKADWARAVWRHGIKAQLSPDTKRDFALSFLSVAQEFTRLPTWKRSSSDPRYYSPCDLPNMDRLSLLITWWEATRDERFAALTLALADNPERGFDPWRDGVGVVELLKMLRDESDLEEFPCKGELLESLECSLISMLETEMAADDLENISDAIEAAGSSISIDVTQAAADAVKREFKAIESVAAEIDSESTLKEHIDSLRRLAPRVGISTAMLTKAISTVNDRIARIAEDNEETSATENSAFRASRSWQPENFDDAALQSLFASLAE